jgi:predicted aminopeptidase
LYRMTYHTRIAIVVSIAVTVLATTSCSNISYYAQSIAGGYRVLADREPINEVLLDPSISPTVKDKLTAVLEMRDFASNSMRLPENDSYRTYVDLKRPYAVWNVFAAPEFSMDMKEWCFLFVGCVRYRGYFDKMDAQEYANELRQDGLDVYVAGIAAYSTIGWFDDPMLNTIINRDEIRLAGLIFHELSHQVVFIKGDTAFNEGFAVAVELEGIKRWLAHKGSSAMLEKYQLRKARHKQFVALVTEVRNILEALYKGGETQNQMRQQKVSIVKKMQEKYITLKAGWDGFPGYDRWFSKPINNAQIAAVTTYQDYVPAFQKLLAQHNYDMDAFYRAVDVLGDLDVDKRKQAISALLN